MNKARCVFDQNRSSPRRSCECPNCIARRAWARTYMRKRYNARPDVREHLRTRARFRYHNDPDFRYHALIYTRAYNRRHHLAHILYNQLRLLMIADGRWR
jgi:hypothetical protein